ncbi:PLC-like phosphodiesterase [Lipomyces chichibuensis]|uniref:PLC-like phosphodiesterase n=1 Tax=Lipomyces chichibuensis TaxID=1546026 RepID=UPI0033435781
MVLIKCLLPGIIFLASGSLALTTCNGHEELCSRQYSNVSFIGAHNSPFVGCLPQQNQEWSVTRQLDNGIRFLQGQTHRAPVTGSLNFCHTSCFLENAGTVTQFLRTVKSWLDIHHNEVVTLLITNGDSVPIAEFDSAFNSSGIRDYAYIPPVSPLAMNDWPTLQDLINAGTRLIVFLDYGANVTEVPYILEEFEYYFETPYDQTDCTFSQCRIDRPSKASASGRMYLVNHTLNIDLLNTGILVPDRDGAATTNSLAAIEAQTDLCSSLYGRRPNVMLLDFVDKGDIIGTQNKLNAL